MAGQAQKRAARTCGASDNGAAAPQGTQPDAAPVAAAQAAGISCRWAKDCMAVGARLSGMTLAEHWNGRKWSAVTTRHTGELVGVTCPATGNCTAVGTNSGGKALAAHWNGKAWSDQSVASPKQLNVLGGLSCTSATNCMAVGDYSDQAGTSDTSFAAQWNGTTWTAVTAPR